MSDTDDTDFLLLIPPDFFLVRSPDLDDFDSDCDVGLKCDHDEVKDSVVSDLITQVNYLESRICMIESVERSATRCSMCNDDSFVNQSVNSLTESDVLRAQVKDKSDLLSKEAIDADLMLKSFEQDFENGTSYQLQKHLSDLEISPRIENFISGDTGLEDTPRPIIISDSVRPTENLTEIQDAEDRKVEEQINLELLKENQAVLLDEVDSFLENKKKQNLTHGLTCTPVSDSKDLEIFSKDSANTVPCLMSDELLHIENSLQIESEYKDLDQSLALPEVYQLLQEMEETQHEIEKKLKLRESQIHSHAQEIMDGVSTSNRSAGNNMSKMYTSQPLGIEDLYAKPTKPVFYKQTENVLERLKSVQGKKYLSTDIYKPVDNKIDQVSYLFTPVLNEDILSYRQESRLKSTSPNRTSLGHSPINVVKANLPRNDSKDTISQFREDQGSPNRSSNFRRHLNFERPNLSVRASKTRPSTNVERNSDNQVEMQRKTENDKLSVHFSHKTRSKSNHSLEEKLNSFSMPRTATDKVNQNAPFGVDNKPSSNEILQQKISSNNLLSLSELWNKEPTFYSDDPNKLRQKLEEEKYRRQHCEQQIQVLQLRVLEEQEKLAVAIKVDQEKDKAILQITESWRKLNDHWRELEEQRHSLAQQLQEEKESAKTKRNELNKKIERWEKEVSQALDLAAGYKEKSEDVQKQMELLKAETEQQLKEANTELDKCCEENKKAKLENQSLLTQVKSLQERINEEEDLLSKLKVELEKSKKQLTEYESEVVVLNEQKESLTSMIKDEKSRTSILEQQKTALQHAVNESTKREKAAQDEVRVSNERIEVARIELRALYQGQLETVVKEKLQEFQGQLEAAEAALKTELHSKEKHWIEKANDQCKQLQDRHKIDLQHKEESYREEINKWKVRLMESEKLKNNYESRLQEETNRRADIAQKLHSVMETQWREALNIISNPLQNVYEMPKDESRSKWPSNEQHSERLRGSGDLRVSRSNSAASLGQGEDAPFSKEGLVTYRTAQPPQDHQLKKYIQMLLERGPGNPIPQHDRLQESLDQVCSENLHPSKWLSEDEKRSAEQLERLGQSSKPPWK